MTLASRRVLLWTTYTWIMVSIGTGHGATINISLHMEPLDLLPLCPGMRRIELHCVHTTESHDPGWRVRGDGLPQYGYAQFGQGLLEHHQLIKDTDTVEVLEIDPVMSSFTYYCLYVIRGVEVITDPLTLNVVDPYTAVRDLTVVIISTSDAVVRWNHTDECEMTDYYEVILVDFTGESVFNDTTKELTKGLANLKPKGKYEVTVTMIGKDGTRGEATSLVFTAGVGATDQISNPTASDAISDHNPTASDAISDHRQNETATTATADVCAGDVSHVACSLYTLAIVLLLMALFALIVLVIAAWKCRSRKRASEQNAAYETEQLPNATNEMAVYQEPESEQDPIIWTNLSSNMYENTAFFSLHTKQFEGQGLPEPGTFV